MAKKPTGTMGPLVIGGTDRPQGFSKIEFPKQKQDVEQMIIKLFELAAVHEMAPRYSIQEIKQNEAENDLDCTIENTAGKSWLMDLAEFVAIKPMKGGHDTAPDRYSAGEMADRMLDTIRDKSTKYVALDRPWLLIYTTAWQFLPSDTVFLILAHDLMRRSPALGRVMYLEILDFNRATVRTIYPVELSIALASLRTDMAKARARRIVNLDNQKWLTPEEMETALAKAE